MPKFRFSLPFRISGGSLRKWVPHREAKSAPSLLERKAFEVRPVVSIPVVPPAAPAVITTERKSLKSRLVSFLHRVMPCLKPSEDPEEVEEPTVEPSMEPSVEPSPPPAQEMPDGYYCTDFLGEGGFGQVSLAIRRSDQKIFAIKAMQMAHIEASKTRAYHSRQEQSILAINRGRPFLATLEVAIRKPEFLYFVMPYYSGGDFSALLESRGRLDEEAVKIYMTELVSAVSLLHQLGYIHADIKPENLMLDGNGHLILADFGVSQKIRRTKEDPYGDRTCTDRVGTILYHSPELIDWSKPPYGRPADWWAVGVVTYQLLTGLHPFYWDSDMEMLYDNIMEAAPPFSLTSVQIGKAAVEFMAGLFVKEPEHRLGSGPNGVKNIKESPFFAGLDWDALKTKQIPPPFHPDPKPLMNMGRSSDLLFITAP